MSQKYDGHSQKGYRLSQGKILAVRTSVQRGHAVATVTAFFQSSFSRPKKEEAFANFTKDDGSQGRPTTGQLISVYLFLFFRYSKKPRVFFFTNCCLGLNKKDNGT